MVRAWVEAGVPLALPTDLGRHAAQLRLFWHTHNNPPTRRRRPQFDPLAVTQLEEARILQVK
jgi:hypothetical protein